MATRRWVEDALQALRESLHPVPAELNELVFHLDGTESPGARAIVRSHREGAEPDLAVKVKGPFGRGAASGYASPVWEGSRLTSCSVVIAPRTLEDPQFFAHVLSHEILHCLGLDHQQDDADSLMSYSNNSVGLSLEELPVAVDAGSPVSGSAAAPAGPAAQ